MQLILAPEEIGTADQQSIFEQNHEFVKDANGNYVLEDQDAIAECLRFWFAVKIG